MTGNRIGPGLVIAATASGAGKTTVTLGLLRAFRDQGVLVGSAKMGPDYIDPQFHAAASGRTCVTLDGWTMRPNTMAALAWSAARGSDILIVEGVMGLFDGAPVAGSTTDGSTAAFAAIMDWPVILVIDARSQAQSVAPVARGFRDHCNAVDVAGVILNKVAGDRHERLLRKALDEAGIPVFGAVPRHSGIRLPSRHLGLVQAGEHPLLEEFVSSAASIVAASCDLDMVRRIARTGQQVDTSASAMLPPLGQRIGVAWDDAFTFSYGHVLDGWSRAGAEILAFSPLANEAPPVAADAVFLPGGYPELHAGRLSANEDFINGLRRFAAGDRIIYGECGGYMVLGQTLTDQTGQTHRMAGLLDLESSFATSKLTLGYRRARSLASTPFGPAGTVLAGHEFHYARVIGEDGDEPLFEVRDSEHAVIGPAGLRRGPVFGSFLHLVDQGVDTVTARVRSGPCGSAAQR